MPLKQSHFEIQRATFCRNFGFLFRLVTHKFVKNISSLTSIFTLFLSHVTQTSYFKFYIQYSCFIFVLHAKHFKKLWEIKKRKKMAQAVCSKRAECWCAMFLFYIEQATEVREAQKFHAHDAPFATKLDIKTEGASEAWVRVHSRFNRTWAGK